jgi:hypothetical protein
MAHPLKYTAAETLTGHRTITIAELRESNMFTFDPGGAHRNIVLPAEADCAGQFIFISNEADAAEVLTIQDDTPATVCTPTQAEAAVVWCDGVKWMGIAGASS